MDKYIKFVPLYEAKDKHSEDIFEQLDRKYDIELAIQRLPLRAQRVYELLMEDLTQEQIAEQLHISPRTVRYDLTKIRKALKEAGLF